MKIIYITILAFFTGCSFLQKRSDMDTENAILPLAQRLVPLSSNSYAPTRLDEEGGFYFVKDQNSQKDIFYYNTVNSNIKRMTRNPGNDEDVTLSPTGNNIAYVSRRDDAMGDIYIHNLGFSVFFDGEKSVLQVNGKNTIEYSPRWSHDGNFVYFLSVRGGKNLLQRASFRGDKVPLDRDIYARSFDVNPVKDELIYINENGSLCLTESTLVSISCIDDTKNLLLFDLTYTSNGKAVLVHVIEADTNENGTLDLSDRVTVWKLQVNKESVLCEELLSPSYDARNVQDHGDRIVFNNKANENFNIFSAEKSRRDISIDRVLTEVDPQLKKSLFRQFLKNKLHSIEEKKSLYYSLTLSQNSINTIGYPSELFFCRFAVGLSNHECSALISPSPDENFLESIAGNGYISIDVLKLLYLKGNLQPTDFAVVSPDENSLSVGDKDLLLDLLVKFIGSSETKFRFATETYLENSENLRGLLKSKLVKAERFQEYVKDEQSLISFTANLFAEKKYKAIFNKYHSLNDDQKTAIKQYYIRAAKKFAERSEIERSYSVAAKYFDIAFSHNKEDLRSGLGLVDNTIKLKSKKALTTLISRIVDLDRDKAAYWYLNGYLKAFELEEVDSDFIRLIRLDELIAYFNEAVDKRPNNYYINTALGWSYMQRAFFTEKYERDGGVLGGFYKRFGIFRSAIGMKRPDYSGLAVEYFERTYSLSEPDTRERAIASHNLSLSYYHRGDIAQAFKYFIQRINSISRVPFKNEAAKADYYLKAARSGWHGEQFKLSNDLFTKASEYYNTLGDEIHYLEAIDYRALVRRYLQDYDGAISDYLTIVDAYRKRGYETGSVKLALNLAETYYSKGDFDKSLYWINRAVSMKNKPTKPSIANHSLPKLSFNYSGLSETYLFQYIFDLKTRNYLKIGEQALFLETASNRIKHILERRKKESFLITKNELYRDELITQYALIMDSYIAEGISPPLEQLVGYFREIESKLSQSKTISTNEQPILENLYYQMSALVFSKLVKRENIEKEIKEISDYHNLSDSEISEISDGVDLYRKVNEAFEVFLVAYKTNQGSLILGKFTKGDEDQADVKDRYIKSLKIASSDPSLMHSSKLMESYLNEDRVQRIAFFVGDDSEEYMPCKESFLNLSCQKYLAVTTAYRVKKVIDQRLGSITEELETELLTRLSETNYSEKQGILYLDRKYESHMKEDILSYLKSKKKKHVDIVITTPDISALSELGELLKSHGYSYTATTSTVFLELRDLVFEGNRNSRSAYDCAECIGNGILKPELVIVPTLSFKNPLVNGPTGLIYTTNTGVHYGLSMLSSNKASNFWEFKLADGVEVRIEDIIGLELSSVLSQNSGISLENGKHSLRFGSLLQGEYSPTRIIDLYVSILNQETGADYDRLRIMKLGTLMNEVPAEDIKKHIAFISRAKRLMLEDGNRQAWLSYARLEDKINGNSNEEVGARFTDRVSWVREELKSLSLQEFRKFVKEIESNPQFGSLSKYDAFNYYYHSAQRFFQVKQLDDGVQYLEKAANTAEPSQNDFWQLYYDVEWRYSGESKGLYEYWKSQGLQSRVATSLLLRGYLENTEDKVKKEAPFNTLFLPRTNLVNRLPNKIETCLEIEDAIDYLSIGLMRENLNDSEKSILESIDVQVASSCLKLETLAIYRSLLLSNQLLTQFVSLTRGLVSHPELLVVEKQHLYLSLITISQSVGWNLLANTFRIEMENNKKLYQASAHNDLLLVEKLNSFTTLEGIAAVDSENFLQAVVLSINNGKLFSQTYDIQNLSVRSLQHLITKMNTSVSSKEFYIVQLVKKLSNHDFNSVEDYMAERHEIRFDDYTGWVELILGESSSYAVIVSENKIRTVPISASRGDITNMIYESQYLDSLGADRIEFDKNAKNMFMDIFSDFKDSGLSHIILSGVSEIRDLPLKGIAPEGVSITFEPLYGVNAL